MYESFEKENLTPNGMRYIALDTAVIHLKSLKAHPDLIDALMDVLKEWNNPSAEVVKKMIYRFY